MTPDLRRADQDDHDAIVDIVERAYDKYVSRMHRRPAPMLADYRALITGGHVTVARGAVGIDGLIVAWSEPDPSSWYVDNIAVAPAAAGRGLGRQLLDHVDRTAAAAGARRLWLYTNEAMTENLAMYPRWGFREYDRHAGSGFARVYFEREIVRER